MEWLIVEIYLLINSPIIWYMKEALNSPNVKCLYIKIMHQMDPPLLDDRSEERRNNLLY